MDNKVWNERYAGKDLLWSGTANRFLVEVAEPLAAGRALDLGAGEGRNAVWLAERGWQVTAVDFSDVGLAKGRKLADTRGVTAEWVHADLFDYEPPERAYDLVILLYLQLPIADLAPVLRRAASAVAPGGTFLLVAHDASNIEHGHGGPRNAAVLYDASQVAAELCDLNVQEAGIRRRPVQTDAGEKIALDCLVRAERRASLAGGATSS